VRIEVERPGLRIRVGDVKANRNLRKHAVSFELARSVFNDGRLVTVANLEHSQIEARLCPAAAPITARCGRWFTIIGGPGHDEDPADFDQEDANGNRVLSGGRMSDEPPEDMEMPAEIDFSKGVRSLHYIPAAAKILMPASIERSVWEYFSGKAEQRGMELSELLTEVLKRDIEINEALK
jgi:hypothetical protein